MLQQLYALKNLPDTPARKERTQVKEAIRLRAEREMREINACLARIMAVRERKFKEISGYLGIDRDVRDFEILTQIKTTLQEVEKLVPIGIRPEFVLIQKRIDAHIQYFAGVIESSSRQARHSAYPDDDMLRQYLTRNCSCFLSDEEFSRKVPSTNRDKRRAKPIASLLSGLSLEDSSSSTPQE